MKWEKHGRWSEVESKSHFLRCKQVKRYNKWFRSEKNQNKGRERDELELLERDHQV